MEIHSIVVELFLDQSGALTDRPFPPQSPASITKNSNNKSCHDHLNNILISNIPERIYVKMYIEIKLFNTQLYM